MKKGIIEAETPVMFPLAEYRRIQRQAVSDGGTRKEEVSAGALRLFRSRKLANIQASPAASIVFSFTLPLYLVV